MKCSEENECHICVRVCCVEGRGKSLSRQFDFVWEKDDREESSTKSLGGMTRAKDEMGSQIVPSESDISPRCSSDTCLSKSEQQLPSSSSTLSSSDSSGAWISSHFRIQVGSADECVAPGRRQPRETRWTFDRRLSSPETNLKVGLLPLFFMQLPLLHNMFLLFMVRTSPLKRHSPHRAAGVKNGEVRLTFSFFSLKAWVVVWIQRNLQTERSSDF